MAFISFNTSSGGGHEHEVKEGHYGLSVEQFIYDSSAESFIGDVATFVGLTADQVRKVFRRKAPFDTTYKEMEDCVDEVFAWWVNRKPDFTKIKSALTATYNPIENYRRTRSGYESKINGEVKDVGYNNTSNGDTTVEVESAPYDADTYHKDNKSHTTYSEDVDTSNTKTYTDLQTDVNVTDAGNVGVTTNQQMINEELQLRINNNLLFIIIKEFTKEFCIPLYN